MENPPLALSLLPLLENLINTPLAAAREKMGFRLERIALQSTSVILELSFGNALPAFLGSHRIELRVVESCLEKTVCTVHWGDQPSLGRLISLGVKIIPPHMLHRALNHLFGEGVSVEGEQVIIHHLPLMRTLLQRGRTAS